MCRSVPDVDLAMAADADAEAAGGAATSLPPKKKPPRSSRRLKTYEHVPGVPWQMAKTRPAHCARMEEYIQKGIADGTVVQPPRRATYCRKSHNAEWGKAFFQGLKNMGARKAQFNVLASVSAELARARDPASSSASQRPALDELMRRSVRVYVRPPIMGEGDMGSPWELRMCFAEDGVGATLEAEGFVLTPAPLILASSSLAGAVSVATQSSPQSSPLTSPSRPPHSDAVPVGVAGASRAPPPATIPLLMRLPKVGDAAALR